MKNYYRRVWEWRGTWVEVLAEYVKYSEEVFGPLHPDKIPCVPPQTPNYDKALSAQTAGCAFPVGTFATKPLYEKWWAWVPATWGSASAGSWQLAAAGKNW